VFLLSLPSIGTMTLNVSNFIALHPGLVNEVGGHALAHVLYSYVRRAGRGGNRRQMRKLSNRRRRWFVDNIIMHHRRLHERNREIVVSNVRSRVLAKRDAMKKQQHPQLQQSLKKDQNDQTRWRNSKVDLKQKGLAIRGRVDSKMLRARSRWMTLSNATNS
jgi:Uri superfamily endonuclease